MRAPLVDDHDLLAAVARGDREAFAAFFTRWSPRLVGWARARGLAGHGAEELAQDVLLAVWRHAGRFDPARGTAGAWLFTLARNRHIDLFRRDRRVEPDPDDPLFVGRATARPDDAAEAARRATSLRGALAALPEEQRRVLEESHLGGLSLSEVAAREDVPLATVKARVRHALDRLRHDLGRLA